jgi:photosystem II stability/assembly factor-like uncharacterized protein
LTVDASLADASAIQVTGDDGVHWRTVWHSADVGLGALGTRGGLAYITAERDRRDAAGDELDDAPLLLVGSDRGRRWRALTPRLPAYMRGFFTSLRPYFVTSSLGFAVPDPAGPDLGSGLALLRTTDGGRSWRVVPGVRPTGGIAFTDPRNGLLTGAIAVGHRREYEQVLRTADAGAHWRGVAGTAGSASLTALALAGDGTALAAGGNLPKFALFPQLAVLAGDAAGGGWRTLFARGGATPAEGGGGGGGPGPYGQFIQLAAPDAGHLIALAGGCPGGANAPCVGDLWTSSDGGRSWHDTGRTGSEFADRGARDIWLVDGSKLGDDAVLHHSTDGGRTWRAVGRPDTLVPSSLLGSPSQLFAETTAGDFVSADTAASWQPAGDRWLADPRAGLTPVAIAGRGLVVASSGRSGALWVSRDGGRSGRSIRPAGFAHYGMPVAAFFDADHGLAADAPPEFPSFCGAGLPAAARVPVDATADGGRSWRTLARLPPAYAGNVELAAGGGLAAIVGPCVSGRPGVGLSRDGGVHWSLRALPAGLDCETVAAASARMLAVGCAPTAKGPLFDRLLVSRDGGSTWTVVPVRVPCPADAGCQVTGAFGRLWIGGVGVLWSSADGRAWTAVAARYPVAG